MNAKILLFAAAKGCLFVLFASNSAFFANALRTGFISPDGARLLMRLLATVASVAAVTDAWVIATTSPIPLVRLALGLLLLGASQTLFRFATASTRDRTLSLAFSTDVPSHIEESGPYRFVRHPFYLAYMLSWAAIAIATQHTFAIAAFGVTTIFYSHASAREEKKFLRSPF